MYYMTNNREGKKIVQYIIPEVGISSPSTLMSCMFQWNCFCVPRLSIFILSEVLPDTADFLFKSYRYKVKKR